MKDKNCYAFIIEKLEGIAVYKDQNVGVLSRYKTGGNADLLIVPKTAEELVKSINAV